MYGYGADNNKLRKSTREKIPGFFVFQAFRRYRTGQQEHGATGQHGHGATGQHGHGATGQQERNIFTRFAEIAKKTLQKHV